MAAWTVAGSRDGGFWNPDADPDCNVCCGFGIVDLGFDYAACLDNCPACIDLETTGPTPHRQPNFQHPGI